jgi:hypothetical protein
MIKLFILILFLLPKILLGLTIGDDGKISNSSEKSSNLTFSDNSDVFLLKNAGLSNQDTTLNIPNGSELGSKNIKNRYSIYKNIMNKLDYNILSVITDDTRFGETALIFRLGKDCIGIKGDCERLGGAYTRAEFSPINYYGKFKDNVWTSYSIKIVSKPEDWSPEFVAIQQWHTRNEFTPPMFMFGVRKEFGLVMRSEASMGMQIFKDSNPYCLGDRFGGGSYCQVRDFELLALEWNEFKKGEWIDVVQNINFDDNPEKGYFKIWINGNLIIDHRGTTNWSKLKGFNTNEDLVWDYKYGLYTKSKGHEMAVAYDELSLARSCEKLNIENLGYSCNELTKQTAPKALAVVDIEWDYSNNTKVAVANNSQILIDKSKYQSIASNENFEDGDYELMWYWKIYDDNGKLEQDDYLGSDQATISNGILTFTKLNKSFEMENDIQSKNREKINFKTEDGLILISANLDLASDGETEPMAIVGSTSKNKDGNYYAEGPWDDEGKEIIGIAFKLKN